EDRFVINMDRYGNTSAASIPMAVCEAVAAGRVRPNDHLVLIGFGGGLTWAAAVVQWNVTAKTEVSPWHRISRRAVYSLSRVRSAVRRGLRRMQSSVTGIEPGEATNPPAPISPPRK
ncbi:MAG TPA: 3-oxoacyl-[acyl-carrier-protein] synthase III C-terminal domain-containing protein, partial [Chloroflexia bacterium]|nr:3-oxoacyl-[acyl-carrier-protein] synthase III C-terminal domain-containing protein [Chloroflexia bacterium]